MQLLVGNKRGNSMSSHDKLIMTFKDFLDNLETNLDFRNVDIIMPNDLGTFEKNLLQSLDLFRTSTSSISIRTFLMLTDLKI